MKTKKEPEKMKNITSSKENSKIMDARIFERVPTGILGLDNLIQGGFEKNSTNLVVASGGSGKTIFGIQFLIEGMKRKETCMYITFEEKKKEFYSNMLSLGWDLEKYEKDGYFYFIEYTPEKVKTMLEEGGGIIETLILTKKINRVVIDSITSFSLLFESDLQKRASALELYNMLRKWNCTSVLTYERDPITDEKTTSRVLEFESDSIILLYYVRFQKERQRYIEILKMRGTNHSKKVFPFDIKKEGININFEEPFTGEVKDLIVS
ncbi:hypothetical protein MEO93_28125 [Dolichospermum sp. ST_sed3]|nr:hypothetical protein [Dolichospermum sp. ST_sed3]